MREPSLRLPRGVIPGAVLALCLIVPLVTAIALDVGFGRRSAKPSFGEQAGRPFRSFVQKSSREFFDGKVLVQVYVSPPPPPHTGSSSAFFQSDSAEPGITTPKVRSGNLQVRLENRSPEAIDLEVVEVSSDRADLSAGMQRLKLAPGQTMQTSSRLLPREATSKRIAVKIRMRLGDREETRDLVLPIATVARADS